jgi:hypothetical protein
MRKGDWAGEVAKILREHLIPFHIRERKNQFEITVSSGVAVKRLIGFLLPYLVVKKPLARRLQRFPKASARNRFTWVDGSYLNDICSLVDYVRWFNRGKNRRHRWDGESIRAFYRE